MIRKTASLIILLSIVYLAGCHQDEAGKERIDRDRKTMHDDISKDRTKPSSINTGTDSVQRS